MRKTTPFGSSHGNRPIVSRSIRSKVEVSAMTATLEENNSPSRNVTKSLQTQKSPKSGRPPLHHRRKKRRLLADAANLSSAIGVDKTDGIEREKRLTKAEKRRWDCNKENVPIGGRENHEFTTPRIDNRLKSETSAPTGQHRTTSQTFSRNLVHTIANTPNRKEERTTSIDSVASLDNASALSLKIVPSQNEANKAKRSEILQKEHERLQADQQDSPHLMASRRLDQNLAAKYLHSQHFGVIGNVKQQRELDLSCPSKKPLSDASTQRQYDRNEVPLDDDMDISTYSDSVGPSSPIATHSFSTKKKDEKTTFTMRKGDDDSRESPSSNYYVNSPKSKQHQQQTNDRRLKRDAKTDNAWVLQRPESRQHGSIAASIVELDHDYIDSNTDSGIRLRTASRSKRSTTKSNPFSSPRSTSSIDSKIRGRPNRQVIDVTGRPLVTKGMMQRARMVEADNRVVMAAMLKPASTKKTILGATIGGKQLKISESLDGSEVTMLTKATDNQYDGDAWRELNAAVNDDDYTEQSQLNKIGKNHRRQSKVHIEDSEADRNKHEEKGRNLRAHAKKLDYDRQLEQISDNGNRQSLSNKGHNVVGEKSCLRDILVIKRRQEQRSPEAVRHYQGLSTLPPQSFGNTRSFGSHDEASSQDKAQKTRVLTSQLNKKDNVPTHHQSKNRPQDLSSRRDSRSPTAYQNLPALPSGWVVRMSWSKNRPYFVHPDFGSTWHCPVVLPNSPTGLAVEKAKEQRYEWRLVSKDNTEPRQDVTKSASSPGRSKSKLFETSDSETTGLSAGFWKRAMNEDDNSCTLSLKNDGSTNKDTICLRSDPKSSNALGNKRGSHSSLFRTSSAREVPPTKEEGTLLDRHDSFQQDRRKNYEKSMGVLSSLVTDSAKLNKIDDTSLDHELLILSKNLSKRNEGSLHRSDTVDTASSTDNRNQLLEWHRSPWKDVSSKLTLDFEHRQSKILQHSKYVDDARHFGDKGDESQSHPEADLPLDQNELVSSVRYAKMPDLHEGHGDVLEIDNTYAKYQLFIGEASLSRTGSAKDNQDCLKNGIAGEVGFGEKGDSIDASGKADTIHKKVKKPAESRQSLHLATYENSVNSASNMEEPSSEERFPTDASSEANSALSEANRSYHYKQQEEQGYITDDHITDNDNSPGELDSEDVVQCNGTELESMERSSTNKSHNSLKNVSTSHHKFRDDIRVVALNLNSGDSDLSYFDETFATGRQQKRPSRAKNPRVPICALQSLDKTSYSNNN